MTTFRLFILSRPCSPDKATDAGWARRWHEDLTRRHASRTRLSANGRFGLTPEQICPNIPG